MMAMALTFVTMTAAVVGPPEPLPPSPSSRQLAWHEMEIYGFVHFGPNTFTGVEWGEGREHPDVFAPSELDCRQWARTFRDAGLKMLIVTAKHHDGFCLWPSKLSTHTVAQSKWRNGKGDVLRELSDACKEFGLKLGVYLSPWDRNHPTYGTPEYNQVFVGMLNEVLTRYGRVSEVWFDGACGEGPNGKRQVYDWDLFVSTVRKLQPSACIFGDGGPDVRWVGNESGYAGEENWSLLHKERFSPGNSVQAQLYTGHPDGTSWVPAECDVSIRPGWFYHASQDGQVKSVEKLMDIYEGSVGRNASLLLNVPPDRRGLIHENDVQALLAFRKERDRIYGHNLAQGASATSSNVRGPGFEPERVLDGKPKTYWAAADGVTEASLELALPQQRSFDRLIAQESIALGQRIQSFAVDAWVEGGWKELARGTTVGAKRIVRLPLTTSQRVRFRILGARACPTLTTLSLHRAAQLDG